MVVVPVTTEEVQEVVRIANRHGVPIVARGAGTGLAAGAVPIGGGIVLSTTRMNQIYEIDPVNRTAWVGPGVINLDLSRATAGLGLHFAPDPSSQAACTIGGNVANNSGGPHCLAEGSTVNHVLALEVVLADGSVTVVGSAAPDEIGLDLRGMLVGSEGTLGDRHQGIGQAHRQRARCADPPLPGSIRSPTPPPRSPASSRQGSCRRRSR